MRSFSYTLRPSTAAVSAAFGVDELKQLAAQPTPRLDRSPWQASAPQRMQARPSSWASVRVAGNLPAGPGRLSRCPEAPRIFVTRAGTATLHPRDPVSPLP